MSRFLLDTNTCIEYLRGRDPGIKTRIQSHPADEIRLCSVVVAELYFGAFHGSPAHSIKNLRLLALFLPAFKSLTFDDRAAEVLGRIKAELASRGKPIGPYDLQIAAIALVHDLTLVTHNTREFAQVRGLKLDDWQAGP